VREDATVLTDDEREQLIERARSAPAFHHDDVATVEHYSEDGTIRRFVPHVPPSNPSHPPAVWAIDSRHAPLYWFPRRCPRISVWARDAEQQAVLADRFHTTAGRICAAETAWLPEVQRTHLYRYVFDRSQFEPWAEADGQYVAAEVVRPVRVDPIDDVLALHADADVELRFTPRLGPLMDAMLSSGLPFSFVRIRDARR
jgi:hypothetical protein